MVRLCRRVPRLGGLEGTRWLLDHVLIRATDDVVEFAPGLGVGAGKILQRCPRSYVDIERDQSAKVIPERANESGGTAKARLVLGDAAHVPPSNGTASVVFDEAMLSMQPIEKKSTIIAESRGLLRTGGTYVMHELAVTPNTIDPGRLSLIHTDLSKHIHVGVRIGTVGICNRELAIRVGCEGVETNSASDTLDSLGADLFDALGVRFPTFVGQARYRVRLCHRGFTRVAVSIAERIRDARTGQFRQNALEIACAHRPPSSQGLPCRFGRGLVCGARDDTGCAAVRSRAQAPSP